MATVLLFLLSALSLSTQAFYFPKQEEYEIYNQLMQSLANNSFDQYKLRVVFFPASGYAPICTPVHYELTCSDDSTSGHYFLWTKYDSRSLVGQVLISFAYYGITLKGFDWGRYCQFDYDIEGMLLRFNLTSLDCNSSIVFNELKYFTEALKVYASSYDFPVGLTGDKYAQYGGYAANWTRCNDDNQVFHTSFVILTIMVALMDFFIFFFSLGICHHVYDAVYDLVKCKKNPGYPIFWSIVVLSAVWNCGPGWLILSSSSKFVRILLGAMVPLQLLVAVFLQKYIDFPIPSFNWKKLSLHYQGYKVSDDGDIQSSGRNEKNKKKKPRKYFFWEVVKMRFRVRVAISFIVQTLAIWILLILFTYIVIYAITITISLYLYPVITLLRIIFVKAVALCVVFDVALLFSAKPLKLSCKKKALISNISSIAQILTMLSFLPILCFFSFIVGGIIFSDSLIETGLQGIMALLPSAFLILIGWYSSGKLFPEKLIPNESITEEEEKESNDSKPRSRGPSLAEKAKAFMHSTPVLAHPNYGSTDQMESIEEEPERSNRRLLSASRAV